MKIINRLLLKSILMVGLTSFFISTAYAELQPRLKGRAVYDTDLDITWLADANAGGRMSLAEANSWTQSLIIEGVSGWRLPTYPISPNGEIGPRNELSHLFYDELGGTVGSAIGASNDPDLSLFSNIKATYYWLNSGLNQPVVFSFARGFSASTYRVSRRYGVLPVHDGDVADAGVAENIDVAANTSTDCTVNCIRILSIAKSINIDANIAFVARVIPNGKATVFATWELPDGTTFDQSSNNYSARNRALFKVPNIGPGTYTLTVTAASSRSNGIFDPANSTILSKDFIFQ